MSTRARFDVASAKTSDRHTFTCRYVAWATQTADGRSLVGGLYVREQRGAFVYGFHGMPVPLCSPATADRAFDMIRRTALAYYVAQAEELRAAALAA
jgi:hypothetical protein